MVTYGVFRCVSDPIRRAILELLAASESPAGVLASHFEVSRPAISRHLRVLRAAGVVSETRSGRERIYRLEPRALETAAEWLRDVAAVGVSIGCRRLPAENGQRSTLASGHHRLGVSTGASGDRKRPVREEADA